MLALMLMISPLSVSSASLGGVSTPGVAHQQLDSPILDENGEPPEAEGLDWLSPDSPEVTFYAEHHGVSIERSIEIKAASFTPHPSAYMSAHATEDIHEGVVDPEPADAVPSHEPFTDDAPVETGINLNDAEITWYAERHGISLERSLAIANWMTEIGPLIEGFDERFEGNYAQVRVVHGGAKGDPTIPAGQIRVEVRMVDPSDPNFRPVIDAIEAVNSRIAGVELELITVPKALTTLQTEAAAARLSHPNSDIEFDFDRCALVFNPLEPPGVPVGHDCPGVSGGLLQGGRRVGFDKDGSGCDLPGLDCTAGLGAFMGSRYGITTAGHCFGFNGWSPGAVPSSLSQVADSYYICCPNDIYASGYPYYSDQGNDDDVGFIARRFASTEVPGAMWRYGTGEWRLTTHYEWLSRVLGLTLCMSASAAAENGQTTTAAK